MDTVEVNFLKLKQWCKKLKTVKNIGGANFVQNNNYIWHNKVAIINGIVYLYIMTSLWL